MGADNISLDNFLQDRKLRIGQVEINGFVSKQNVANFLGIPFAKFPARFRTAQRLDLKDLQNDVDATSYGPRCPQKVDVHHHVMSNVFERLSTSQRCDEYTCLRLNVYTPRGATGAPGGAKYPVFAWIHGGGFTNGDNTTEFGT